VSRGVCPGMGEESESDQKNPVPIQFKTLMGHDDVGVPLMGETDVTSTRDPLENIPSSVLGSFANCCNGLYTSSGYSPVRAPKELRYPPEDWEGPLPHLIVMISRSSGGGVGKKVLRVRCPLRSLVVICEQWGWVMHRALATLDT
jgi:hypothetical protein